MLRSGSERDEKIAQFVACHCNKGAVADFIEYIEKTAGHRD